MYSEFDKFYSHHLKKFTFLQIHVNLEFFPHCAMNGGHFVDTINSLNCLTLTFDHGFNSEDDGVVHKTCCFDIDLFLAFLPYLNRLTYWS